MDLRKEPLKRVDGLALRSASERVAPIGWALFANMIATLLTQVIAVVVAREVAPRLVTDPRFLWGVSVVASYGVGFVLFAAIIRRAPRAAPLPRAPMGPLHLGQCYAVAIAALYLGNLISLALNALIALVKGAPVANPVELLLDRPVGLNLLLVCVLAPVFEELMFRRLLLDRLRPYGERFALFGSAVMFALIHGNFSQMFYAFAVGVVLAWVVLKTGCLWQAILIHAGINAISSGLSPLLEQMGQSGWVLMSLFMLAGTLLGVTFFLAYRRDLRLDRGESPLTERQKWRLYFENPGMILFCLVVLYEVVTVLLAV